LFSELTIKQYKDKKTKTALRVATSQTLNYFLQSSETKGHFSASKQQPRSTWNVDLVLILQWNVSSILSTDN